MAISSIGVGSGLDLSTLLANLQAAEETKLDVITAKQKGVTTKLSAYGLVQGALASFQTAAAALGTASLYNSTKVTSSKTDVLTTTSDKTAAAGNYAVNVTQLAQAQSLASGGIVDGTGMLLGEATINIDFGTTNGAVFTQGTQPSAQIKINGTNNTLAGIRDAINAANAGVTASMVNDGGATPYHLVLTSNTTGESSSMRVTVGPNGGGDSSMIAGLLTYDPAGTKAMTENVQAANAKLTVNGMNISSQSNTVKDAAQGLTLNLLSTGTSNIAVTTDTSAMTTAVQNFVSAYNTLQSTAAGVSDYDPDTKTAGALLGDTALRSIQNQLRGVINTPQESTGPSSLTNLTQIGIGFKADGTMTLDTDKLNKALAGNRTGVAQLLSGTDGKSGYGNQISALAKSFTASKGVLTSATDGLNLQIKSLTTDYNTMSGQIDATIAQYRAQFQRLDAVMSQFNNTKNYLTQQFNAMNNSTSK